MIKYDEFLQETLNEIKFEEAFDIDALQELQDLLAKSLEIASIITDLDGRPLTTPSNFCSLCNDYVRTTNKGLKQCMYSDAVIGSNTDGYTVSQCLSAGLMDAGVAIKVGDKHVANWLFGQVRSEQAQLSEDELRTKARDIGVEEEGFIRAYNQVPLVSKERFEYIARLVFILSKQLSEQAYTACISKSEQKYRKMLDEELAYQKELAEYESYVDELTKLNNRNYFEKQVERLDLSQTVPVAIIVGDVNYLKLTNDIFGHRHGDWLLSRIAHILKEESFDNYIICRCGGDEFNILIPNANRQDADWYIKRVNIELAKVTDCCFRPSIAFGVSKKSHPKESIKNILEFADLKMYRNKIQMKEDENLLDNLKNVLLARGYETHEYQRSSIAIARGFAEYLGYDEQTVKAFTRIIRIQDYGNVVLSPEYFEKRNKKKLPLEILREVMKHPVIASRIANLDPDYAPLSNIVIAHEEHWDGTGYPNNLAGEAIPFLARMSKLVGDYNIMIAKPPIGLGKTKESAIRSIRQQKNKIYDPKLSEQFIEFLKQYE